MRGRALTLVLVALVSAGCTLPWQDDGDDGGGGAWPPTRPTAATPSPEPPLVFGGTVVDAVTDAPVPEAEVRLDLAFTRPCRQQGIGYASWDMPVDEEGAWGPEPVPRPRSDDVAFFLHVTAPSYAENVTFIGPAEARGDLGNLTVRMHPDAAITGAAPPATVVALDAPRFPRVTVADEDGRFRFDDARAVEVELVAATDVPFHTRVAPPANVTVNATAPDGWLLEGLLRLPTGAPMAADVVAWNGTHLWSAARAGENGVFALPLPPEPVALRVEALTQDQAYGGTKVVEVDGPPAVRETVLMRALC